MPRINPAILTWARETAGLSPEDAARKIGINDTLKFKAVERLHALEIGDIEPSRPLLLKMAKQYRRPLISFYLSAVPARGERGDDFRTLPEGRDQSSEALVDALVRDIRARQEMVRASLLDEDAQVLSFVASRSMGDGVMSVVNDIKQKILFDRLNFRGQRNPEDGFASLRSAVEDAGIFVMLIGNLGSHHTALECEVFRGFALADPIAPFIVINDQDAKAAWSFTLLHELAHLWLGQTGISGANAASDVEKFCNDVASYILLPQEEVAAMVLPTQLNLDSLIKLVSDFARPRNLSYSLVAYRLLAAERISHDLWQEAHARFRMLWQRERLRARAAARENDSGGPSYYIVRRHKLGKALLSFVRQQLDAGDLTPSKAAKILGVKARSVFPLVKDDDLLRFRSTH